MKNILLISSFCMLCIGFSSCSNENDEFVQDNKESDRASNVMCASAGWRKLCDADR